MDPVVPAELFHGAVELVVYLLTAVGALLSFVLTGRA